MNPTQAISSVLLGVALFLLYLAVQRVVRRLREWSQRRRNRRWVSQLRATQTSARPVTVTGDRPESPIGGRMPTPVGADAPRSSTPTGADQ